MENAKTGEMAYDFGISDLRDAMTSIVVSETTGITEFSLQVFRSLQQIQDALNALDYRIAVIESRAGRI